MEIRNKDGLTEKEFLAQYKPGDYERPSVTTDILLFTIDEKETTNIKLKEEKELKILLIQRKNHPYINKWALPGGFVGMDENTETAAYRELEEETNLKEDIYLEQLYTFSEPNRDPRMRVISTAYIALTPNKNIKRIQAGDDASDAKWFTIKKDLINENEDGKNYILYIINEELNINIQYNVNYSYETKKNTYSLNSEDSLAFDHIDIIDMGLNRIRNKIFYTTIAFNLLPEYFTLKDLQQVYEIILGEKLVTPNFRIKIEPMVISTEEYENKKVGYRPAKLFKLNKKYIEH